MDYDNNRTFNENMKARLQRGKQAASEFSAEARAKARRAARNTNNYVHDHPWRVIATASVISFAIGALLPRKRKAEIIVRQAKPVVIKKEAARGAHEKRAHTGDVLKALIPVALTLAKALQSSRAKHKHEAGTSFASTNATAQPIP